MRSACFAILVAADDGVNVPLALAVIAVSTIAIIGAIVWGIRRRDRYDPSTDDPLLRSLDTVEWYGHDISADLVQAEPDQRSGILDAADRRVSKAHAQLLATSQLEGDEPAWQGLLEAMTSTETRYRSFARGESDDASVREAARDLLYRLEQVRDRLG